jgi:shikimate kinase
MNLVLIGYRGTGKTTVARLVAERLNWPACDSDEQIEELAGKSIAEIFRADGEEAFRALEAQAVETLSKRDCCVVALGGGAVLRAENRQAIARQGKVVWLAASPETLWQRIQADDNTAARRPNLTAAGGISEIIATLALRDPIYRQCADLEVDTTDKTPCQVADAILAGVDISD